MLSCLLRCSQEDGQCHCLPSMIGRRCSDPAPGYFLPLLDYFLYEAELAAPLQQRSSSSSSTTTSSLVCNTISTCDCQTLCTCVLIVLVCILYFGICVYFQVNTVVLPQCEQYFRDQGFDFKFSNGQVVLVRRTRQITRQRRQGQVGGGECCRGWGCFSLNSLPVYPLFFWVLQETSILLEPGHALQIVPRQRTSSQLITWTGLGLVRVLEGAGLRFTVENLPLSMEFQLVIRYETEVRRTIWVLVLVLSLL